MINLVISVDLLILVNFRNSLILLNSDESCDSCVFHRFYEFVESGDTVGCGDSDEFDNSGLW